MRRTKPLGAGARHLNHLRNDIVSDGDGAEGRQLKRITLADFKRGGDEVAAGALAARRWVALCERIDEARRTGTRRMLN